jgi:hypothetical protein
MGGIRGTDVPEIDQSIRIGFLGVTNRVDHARLFACLNLRLDEFCGCSEYPVSKAASHNWDSIGEGL